MTVALCETVRMAGHADGRAAFEQQAWRDAYTHLFASAADTALDLEDLERLAAAAYLIGYADESAEHWALAHSEWVRLGNVPRATRCAFWLAFGLLNRGDLASGGGWVDRGLRLLEEHESDGLE